MNQAPNKNTLWFDFKEEVMQRIWQTMQQVANSNTAILISGDASTGKKTLATKIHEISQREKPSILINANNVVEDHFIQNIEQQLRSAFGSTLIIQHVDKLPMECQTKLNAVLRQMVIELDPPRIIATTTKDLSGLVQQNNFLKELYFRLNVINMKVPSLSDRKKDIPHLAEHLLKTISKNDEYRLTSDAASCLVDHSWTGNFQELNNIVSRTLLLSTSFDIDAKSLQIERKKQIDKSWINNLPIGVSMKDLETQFILETLKRHNGNRTHCARTLGISLRTLRNKINEFLAMGMSVTSPSKGRATTLEN